MCALVWMYIFCFVLFYFSCPSDRTSLVYSAEFANMFVFHHGDTAWHGNKCQSISSKNNHSRNFERTHCLPNLNIHMLTKRFCILRQPKPLVAQMINPHHIGTLFQNAWRFHMNFHFYCECCFYSLKITYFSCHSWILFGMYDFIELCYCRHFQWQKIRYGSGKVGSCNQPQPPSLCMDCVSFKLSGTLKWCNGNSINI